MALLRKAYKTAEQMGRSPKGLKAAYTARVFKRGRYGIGGPLAVVKGRVRGSSANHRVVVAWPTDAFEFKHLDSLNTECQFHCDCQDFVFTFYPYLKQREQAILEVDYPEIGNKTRSGPPRAIQGYGMCKHVMAVIDQARNDGLID